MKNEKTELFEIDFKKRADGDSEGSYNTQSNPLYYASALYVDGAPLTELVIPEGVERIAPRAFDGCSSIKSITLPASLQKIGDHAFRGTGIVTITLGANISEVGKYVFYSCSALTDIYLAHPAVPNTWSAHWAEGSRATVHFGE